MKDNTDRQLTSEDISSMLFRIRFYIIARIIILIIGLLFVFGMILPNVFTYHKSVSGQLLVLAGLVIAYLLMGKRCRRLADVYEYHRSKSVDPWAIIGQYIDLEGPNAWGTFTAEDVADLWPIGGFGNANKKLHSKRMMAGRYKGVKLRSAHVEYCEEGYGETYDPETTLFSGQMTIIDAPTGFSGKLLLLKGGADTPRNAAVTKRGMKVMLGQAACMGQQFEAEQLPGWQVYTDNRREALELFASNVDFVERMRSAWRIRFMLVRPDGIVFFGDYDLNFDSCDNDFERMKASLNASIEYLVEEGFDTALSVRRTR